MNDVTVSVADRLNRNLRTHDMYVYLGCDLRAKYCTKRNNPPSLRLNDPDPRSRSNGVRLSMSLGLHGGYYSYSTTVCLLVSMVCLFFCQQVFSFQKNKVAEPSRERRTVCVLVLAVLALGCKTDGATQCTAEQEAITVQGRRLPLRPQNHW